MKKQARLNPVQEERKQILSSRLHEYLVNPVIEVEGNESVSDVLKSIKKKLPEAYVLVVGGASLYGLITVRALQEHHKTAPEQSIGYFVNCNIPEVPAEIYAVQALDFMIKRSFEGLVVEGGQKGEHRIATLQTLSPVTDVLSIGACIGEAALGNLLLGTEAGSALFHAAADTATTPEGPYVTKEDCECAVIIYVQDSTIGSVIDGLTGSHGYSHVAIDCCECEESTGKRVVIEAVENGVIRSYADKYEGRPSVRIQVENYNIDCEKFCEKVKDRLGEPFDFPGLATGGLLDDPDAQVCADLVTLALPDWFLEHILAKKDDKLKDTIFIHGETITISPNAFALCAGAPNGTDVQDEETPVEPPESPPTPPEDPEEPGGTPETPEPPEVIAPCHVKIDLMRITHRGKIHRKRLGLQDYSSRETKALSRKDLAKKWYPGT